VFCFHRYEQGQVAQELTYMTEVEVMVKIILRIDDLLQSRDYASRKFDDAKSVLRHMKGIAKSKPDIPDITRAREAIDLKHSHHDYQ
jgi:hypothetical protein